MVVHSADEYAKIPPLIALQTVGVLTQQSINESSNPDYYQSIPIIKFGIHTVIHSRYPCTFCWYYTSPYQLKLQLSEHDKESLVRIYMKVVCLACTL